MSHPTQFRVYLPKDEKCAYTTGFQNGKPVVLLSLAEGEKFQEIFSPEFETIHGKPVVQASTGLRDKNEQSIFEGDVIFWHKFNWLGVVVRDENLAHMTFDSQTPYWCQMKDGMCSLVGSEHLVEVLFPCGLITSDKIITFLTASQDVLLKNKIKSVPITS